MSILISTNKQTMLCVSCLGKSMAIFRQINKELHCNPLSQQIWIIISRITCKISMFFKLISLSFPLLKIIHYIINKRTKTISFIIRIKVMMLLKCIILIIKIFSSFRVYKHLLMRVHINNNYYNNIITNNHNSVHCNHKNTTLGSHLLELNHL